MEGTEKFTKEVVEDVSRYIRSKYHPFKASFILITVDHRTTDLSEATISTNLTNRDTVKTIKLLAREIDVMDDNDLDQDLRNLINGNNDN